MKGEKEKKGKETNKGGDPSDLPCEGRRGKKGREKEKRRKEGQMK